jgi:hypothetical protein
VAAKEGGGGALHPPFVLTAAERARSLRGVVLTPLRFLGRSSSRWASAGDSLGPSPGRASVGCGGFKRGAAAAGHRFGPQRRCLVSSAAGGGMGSLCSNGVRPDLAPRSLDLALWCGDFRRREVWVGVIGRRFPLPSHKVSAASMV